MNKKYKKTLALYKIFSDPRMDFSNEAALAMFEFDSFGKGNLLDTNIFTEKKTNGYAYGKRIMDITISMWFETLSNPGWGNLLAELYADSQFPHWWLDKIFKNFFREKEQTHGVEWINKILKEIKI